ncbi:MAG: hypothetical protein K1W19_08445 [Lachnospiraceae bacterium]
MLIISSTNRSNARDSHIADYYTTPISDVELFLKEFDKRIKLNWNKIKIVDCCAGGNHEIRDEYGIKEIYHPMSYQAAIHNVFGNCNVNNIDIREDSLAEVKGDYLEKDVKIFAPQVIITNPPFFSAVPIIEKALNDVAESGYVIMLLRLNFFGSKERWTFFDKYMPEWCFVHHVRIGFTDKKDENGYVVFDKHGNAKRGSTDSIEYMHAVWRKGYKPDYTKLVVI